MAGKLHIYLSLQNKVYLQVKTWIGFSCRLSLQDPWAPDQYQWSFWRTGSGSRLAGVSGFLAEFHLKIVMFSQRHTMWGPQSIAI